MNDELLHDMTKRDIKENGGNVFQLLAVAIQDILQEKGLPLADTGDLNDAIEDILYNLYKTRKGVWELESVQLTLGGTFLKFRETTSGLVATNYCDPDRPNRYSTALLKAMGKTYEDVAKKNLGKVQILANTSSYTSGGRVYHNLIHASPYIWEKISK